MLIHPDLETKLIMGGSFVIEISSDYVDSVMIQVYDIDEPELDRKCFMLEPDEVDVFISILNLYKNRIGKRSLKRIEE